jgi:hypothetical protein
MLLQELFAWMHYDLEQRKNEEAGLFLAKRLRELADPSIPEDKIQEPPEEFRHGIAKS